MTEPRYQLAVTLGQLQYLQTMIEKTSASEADPDAEVFQLLDLVRKTRLEALKSNPRNQVYILNPNDPECHGTISFLDKPK